MGIRSRLGRVTVVAMVAASFVGLGAAPALGGPGCDPGTIEVTTGTEAALRDAFDVANGLDGPVTICIDTGLGPFVLTAGELVYDNSPHDDPGLTILGNGATIDANLTSGVIVNDTPGLLTLDHLTVTRGEPEAGAPGGAISSFGPVTLRSSTVSASTAEAGAGIASADVVTLTDSTVTGNVATGCGCGSDGGGIYAYQVVLTRSVVSLNTATGAGGGIYAFDSVELTDSTVSTNTSDDYGGGGIYTLAGTVEVTGSQVVGNTALGCGCGGGISAGDDVTVTRSTVSGNSAADGGGIEGALVTVVDSTIAGNSATGGDGGGINALDAVVRGSTVSGNTTDGGGGGIFSLTDVLLVNSTVTANAAGTGGGVLAGGFYSTHSRLASLVGAAAAGDGEATTVYATIAANAAAGAANLHAESTFRSFGTVISGPQGGGANCAVGTGASSGFNHSDDSTCAFTAGSDHQGAAAPQLGALAANGGPTSTLLPAESSPLIGAVPVASCGGGDGLAGSAVTTDQRGVARPQRVGCDIGAVEVAPPTGSTATAAAPCTTSLVTIAASVGTLGPITQTALPASPTPPPGLLFSCGLLAFDVTNLNVGQSVTITATVPGVRLGQYWKLQRGTWTQMTTTSPTESSLRFTLTDGGVGDADGVANGTIVDPGAPSVLVSFTG